MSVCAHFFRALRQRLLSERREEESRLNQESSRTLEEVRQSVQKEREEQQQKLRSDPQIHHGARGQWFSG